MCVCSYACDLGCGCDCACGCDYVTVIGPDRVGETSGRDFLSVPHERVGNGSFDYHCVSDAVCGCESDGNACVFLDCGAACCGFASGSYYRGYPRRTGAIVGPLNGNASSRLHLNCRHWGNLEYAYSSLFLEEVSHSKR